MCIPRYSALASSGKKSNKFLKKTAAALPRRRLAHSSRLIRNVIEIIETRRTETQKDAKPRTVDRRQSAGRPRARRHGEVAFCEKRVGGGAQTVSLLRVPRKRTRHRTRRRRDDGRTAIKPAATTF